MEKDNIVISNNIKKYRNLTGLLQSEVARKLGISYSKYSNMENSPSDYSLKELKRLADFYGCNVYDFFIGCDNR